MENRLEELRKYVDKLICKNAPELICIYSLHSYGVSMFSALLAKKRNLNVEIAATCAMLHDIGYMEVGGVSENHASNGAKRAHFILNELGCYNDNEIEIIVSAIKHHSEKLSIHSEYDEVLKDADVMSHCFYNNDLPIKKHENERYCNLLAELGINPV